MSDSPNLLFVYGTLRRREECAAARILAESARYLGLGRTRGVLYALGEYPGLVSAPQEPQAWVIGELYRLREPARVLPALDVYEGCGPHDPGPHEYARTVCDVVFEPGREARAWVYLYCGSLRDSIRIVAGDYMSRLSIGKR